MLNSLFDGTTLPVLEQVVQFTQARHGVLAGNIANLDTPGYRTRDLSPQQFQERLQEALAARRQSLPGGTAALNRQLLGAGSPSPLPASAAARSWRDLDQVSDSMKSVLYHDESDVSLERQIAEISKNQSRHNLALGLMTHQFQLLQAAIAERP
jgi:flagellar basal-body rod protein FlgB